MRIEVLGPVRAYAGDGAPIEVGGARVRALLARLALARGEVVSVDSLLDGLWGERPSGDHVNALHALVHRLRRALGGAGVVETVAGGYRLNVGAEEVDAVRFEALARRGGRELAAGAAEQAAALLRDALKLWRGDALADVRDLPFAGTAGARLDELRVGAVEDRFEAELRLGHHGEILADVEAAAAGHPLRERLAGLRMRALHAAGRQSDALAVFDEVRRTLTEELGVDPSEELRRTHVAVLRGELEIPEAAQARPEAVPGRLPAQLTSFVGREDELRLLAGLLEASRLVTVVGPGGVGKTRLAVEVVSRHRAHRRGRVWLVPLAGVNTADGLPEAVLGTLGTADGRASGTPLDRVVNLLAGGEGVLVLDNCEQISEPVAEFARHLLERQPYLTILATSRGPLEVMGEALCRLGPLELPPGTRGSRSCRRIGRGAAVPRSGGSRIVAGSSTSYTARLRTGRVDGGPGRGHRAPAGRAAARPGAGRGAAAYHERRSAGQAARRPLPAAQHRQQGSRAQAADPPRGHRVELGPPHRSGTDAGAPDVDLSGEDGDRRDRGRLCG
ncbi:AfsR/SARP family transcriptional regulator [Nonomuraea roseola]|uniref:AfsR/SARP family transcriptional regulator n=1 Tax=Nonomuraea roseola TaxID=46179 RepID=UPI0031FA0AB1